ncbi:TPA: hypothetical protein J1066_001549 [Escherichia coli]|nr:hypothetical protein [Escherichia coli]HBB0147961.1 hypothetical protein [Escherichia coli]
MFPAPAGINRAGYAGYITGSGVPRASGDKPGVGGWGRPVVECSPRQRG